jgi:ABC-2 type transport system ATP-binding protein
VRAVWREQAEDMTEFDAVTVRGVGKTYGSGVVVGRLDLDVSHGEMAGAADVGGTGQAIPVECIEGLRRPGGALRVLGYSPVTGAVQLRPLIGGQLQDSALPDRVAGALDLFATLRARDGTQLLEQFGWGERGRRGFSSLSGREPQRLFIVLTRPGRPGRTS